MTTRHSLRAMCCAAITEEIHRFDADQ